MNEDNESPKTEKKSHSVFSFFNKKKILDTSIVGNYGKPEDEDEDLFENKNEEIKKYTLVAKFKAFILNRHEVIEPKKDEGAGFTKGLMDSDGGGDSKTVLLKNYELNERNIFLKLRWWDWLILFVELSLIIYTILVFMKLAPMF